MGHAIPVRMDYTAGEVRRLAQRAKDAAQARRLLAIAAVLEGALREEAAKIGGMDRHSPEDHVHRATRLGSSRSLNLRIGISFTAFPGGASRVQARHLRFRGKADIAQVITLRLLLAQSGHEQAAFSATHTLTCYT